MASQLHGTTTKSTISRSQEPAVVVRGLRCRYGTNEAVKGIDLEIAKGEIFALLGPNGAGKTSTIEILEGFRSRSDGEARVLGVDPEHAHRGWRGRIGVVLQDSRPEPELSVRECVALYAGYYERARDIDETVALVGLGELAGRRCEQLSGGECRRLDVALALIGDPELVFLDEPTVGFDPAARRAAWELVLGLRGLGKTIVLTTHYMEEAEHLADRIAVIVHGQIVATGTPQTLGARELMDVEIRFTLPAGVALSDLPAGLEAAALSENKTVTVRAEGSVSALFSLTRWAIEHDRSLPDLEVRRPSLEDVYLELTRAAEGDQLVIRLLAHQTKYELLTFIRNRQGPFFTVALPVIFLVIFVSVFGSNRVGPEHVKASTYYVPGIAALAILSAAFANLVISITAQRELGILKRRRATPVPAWLLVAARALSALVIAMVVVTVVIALGRLAYGVHLTSAALPAVVLTVAVGSLAFACLGYALSTVIGSAEGAQPVVLAVTLPLYFISGVFIPPERLPSFLQHVAEAFPVQHLVAALHTGFVPAAHAGSVAWGDLGVVAAWGLAGFALALARFSWSPRSAAT